MHPNTPIKLPFHLDNSVKRFAKKSDLPLQTAVKKLIKKGLYVHGQKQQ